jgi:hypothetical protein
MSYVGYFLFPFAVAFMIYATVSYGRAIKTSGLPGRWVFGDSNRWWNVPWWIEGKWFRLWWLFGVNLIVGLSILFGSIFAFAKVSHPEWYLVGYTLLGPLVHWGNVRAMYEWSVRQGP